MKKFYRFCVFAAQFITLGLALAFVASVISPRLVTRIRHAVTPIIDSGSEAQTSPPAHAVPIDTASMAEHVHDAGSADRNKVDFAVSYAAAVARAAPAVVNIYANKVISTRQVLVPSNPVLRRVFPGIAIGPPEQHRQQSLGSGVIFSTNGYVLTNNHVIQGAEEIQVQLYDGRTTRARIIGTDAETDLAVLKIDASNLPSITIADQSPPNVGDVVLAIGNPFGIGRTVTMGIVSATGRQLNLSTYEDFIQTDAAINQGNSGGALVNAYGELVGINSDIYSPSGSNVGIGFAIPVATAKAVLDQIVAHGRVIRGWLGAEYANVASLQDPTSIKGVAIIGVYANGPAAQAGLRKGDVLLRMNNKPIANQLALRNREASMSPGTKVRLSGRRNGVPFTVVATLQERPQQGKRG